MEACFPADIRETIVLIMLLDAVEGVKKKKFLNQRHLILCWPVTYSMAYFKEHAQETS